MYDSSDNKHICMSYIYICVYMYMYIVYTER